LLDRLQGVGVQRGLPAFHLRLGPVAIHAANSDDAVFVGLGDHLFQQRRLCVVAVNQQGKAPAVWHRVLLIRNCEIMVPV